MASLSSAAAQSTACAEGKVLAGGLGQPRSPVTLKVACPRLAGIYVECGVNHGKKVFKRKDYRNNPENAYIYYWDSRDGSDSCGWWFGRSIGGSLVWARSQQHLNLPPERCWHVPWDGPVTEHLCVSLLSKSSSSHQQLGDPRGVAVDQLRNMIVSDCWNNCVTMFAPGAAEGKAVAGGNGEGGALNQLCKPHGVTMDGCGYILIADYGNDRVVRWRPGAEEGDVVAGGNGHGPGLNQLKCPTGIAIDEQDNILIADCGNHRVVQWAPGAAEGKVVAGGNGKGSGLHQLHLPKGVTSDGQGSILVADSGNDRVVQWALDGVEGKLVAGGNGDGQGLNQVCDPVGVITSRDGQGSILILEYANSRVLLWPRGAAEGKVVAGGNGQGPGLDQLCRPEGITSDHEGNLVIADSGNHRVVQWLNAPPPATSDQEGPCTWQFEDAGQWRSFAAEDSIVLDQFWRSWRYSANPQDGGSTISVCFGTSLQEINFPRMEQTSTSSGAVRRLRRIPQFSTIAASGVTAENELVQLRKRLRSAEEQLEDAKRLALTLPMVQKEMEMWRHQDASEPRQFPKPQLVPLLQKSLKEFMPPQHVGDCARVLRIEVTDVVAVANMHLWQQYKLKRDQIRKSLANRSSCPWLSDICSKINRLQEKLEYPEMERGANEALLLHGTTLENAEAIAKQGFDERLTHRALYGKGVYLTIDSCKAIQYCGDGTRMCLIIARAILGHPYEAQRDMPTHSRPPLVDGQAVPHDSTIARPGIPNGLRKGKGKGTSIQQHWEFIVPDTQLYPEMLVYFTLT